METIESIEKVDGLKLKVNDPKGWHPDTWDGYRVTTSKRQILLLVSDGQSCCETWGMISSEDDPATFVGASLERVDWTGKDREVRVDVLKAEEYGIDEGEMMFVDLVTDRGVLQLAVYNCHNGFYGHSAVLLDGDAIKTIDII